MLGRCPWAVLSAPTAPSSPTSPEGSAVGWLGAVRTRSSSPGRADCASRAALGRLIVQRPKHSHLQLCAPLPGTSQAYHCPFHRIKGLAQGLVVGQTQDWVSLLIPGLLRACHAFPFSLEWAAKAHLGRSSYALDKREAHSPSRYCSRPRLSVTTWSQHRSWT